MPRPLVRVEVLREAAGMRVDRFLREKLPSVPHSLLCKLMRKRAIVKLDGERRVRLEPNTRLAAGDVLGVTDSLAASKEPLSTSKETLAPRPEAAVSKRHVEALRAALLRETPNYLVFNKPARLPVQGGERIAQHVAALLPHLPLPDAAELRTVHRLDSGTTGVLVVARSRAAARELCGLFLEHKVSKRYLALAYGELRDARGSVSAPLQPVFVFGKGQRMQLVAPQGGGFTSPMTQARAADTRYRLLAEGSDGDERFS
jgi:23S rRNA pseudouridine955/2504/2580 synthase